MNPSCFKKQLGVEACNHGCPVSDKCYQDDQSINALARHAGSQYIKNRLLLASCAGSVIPCALKLSGNG